MMLRVLWETDESEGMFSGKNMVKHSGIVFGSNNHSLPFLLVREENGTLCEVAMAEVTKSEWVEKP